DGIRDFHVTGVQTCALPIFMQRFAQLGAHYFVIKPFDLEVLASRIRQFAGAGETPAARDKVADGRYATRRPVDLEVAVTELLHKIGRASCRERVGIGGGWWR